MIPNISFDFNFDLVLILIFASYVFYGYFSGGHKQIRLSINLILPFLIIYYLGRYITSYMYVPISNTFIFEIINTYLGIVKNTFGMIIAYFITYMLLFILIFTFSIYAKRKILNENMRAKLGKKNNYLGALFAFINGYVLIYFIILPVFSINLVGEEAIFTNFVLDNPPPFSRIARTAEKAVPIKGLADKANDFQQLLSVDGIEGYYNEAIVEYQQLYMGSDSLETDFMQNVYSNLSNSSKQLLDDAYFDIYGENLSLGNYIGVSRVLVLETSESDYLYLDLLTEESSFEDELNANKLLVAEYTTALNSYDSNVEKYEYSLLYETYTTDLETYITSLEEYTELKINAIINETEMPTPFTMDRPTINVEAPTNYVHEGVVAEPSEVILTATVQEAIDYVDSYEGKPDVRSDLRTLGLNFKNHRGLLVWYADELNREMSTATDTTSVSSIIVSFKDNYENIMSDINDEDLESKLYLAKMSITSFDVFTIWLDCTLNNMDTINIDDLENSENRCIVFDPSLVTEYDFTGGALSLVKTLFEGDSVNWIIMQYKYDYDAGGFVDEFSEFSEILDVLESTKELADDYDEYYRDIAISLEGNISMVFKIGISVMKYHLDVYDTLTNTPILSAIFNDASRVCSGSVTSPINRDVTVCPKTSGDNGTIKELLNARFLVSDILFKAYIMVDNENQPIIYDSEYMEEFLVKVNKSVENHVITQEVISMFGDQFAFNIIDDTNNYTLLQQMYDDGQITIEAMRILADDEYGLFSSEFSQRVRSLIR